MSATSARSPHAPSSLAGASDDAAPEMPEPRRSTPAGQQPPRLSHSRAAGRGSEQEQHQARTDSNSAMAAAAAEEAHRLSIRWQQCAEAAVRRNPSSSTLQPDMHPAAGAAGTAAAARELAALRRQLLEERLQRQAASSVLRAGLGAVWLAGGWEHEAAAAAVRSDADRAVAEAQARCVEEYRERHAKECGSLSLPLADVGALAAVELGVRLEAFRLGVERRLAAVEETIRGPPGKPGQGPLEELVARMAEREASSRGELDALQQLVSKLQARLEAPQFCTASVQERCGGAEGAEQQRGAGSSGEGQAGQATTVDSKAYLPRSEAGSAALAAQLEEQRADARRAGQEMRSEIDAIRAGLQQLASSHIPAVQDSLSVLQARCDAVHGQVEDLVELRSQCVQQGVDLKELWRAVRLQRKHLEGLQGELANAIQASVQALMDNERQHATASGAVAAAEHPGSQGAHLHRNLGHGELQEWQWQQPQPQQPLTCRYLIGPQQLLPGQAENMAAAGSWHAIVKHGPAGRQDTGGVAQSVRAASPFQAKTSRDLAQDHQAPVTARAVSVTRYGTPMRAHGPPARPGSLTAPPQPH